MRRGLIRALAAACLIVMPVVVGSGDIASSSTFADERKQPMQFTWHTQSRAPEVMGSCAPLCMDFVAAVGTVTSETPKAFEAFARRHDLRGATIVLNSGGGSVLDTLTLGRRWRSLGVQTTVGATIAASGPQGMRAGIQPDAACESMCVFLLLAGENRHVPPGARIRVHQIWMGDRATNAQASSYTAQDMTIVQRDVGQLAQYTFEMGGSGALLSLALSVPPWEPLHELSAEEIIAANLVTGTRDGAVAVGVSPAAVSATQAATGGEQAAVQGKLLTPRVGSQTASIVTGGKASSKEGELPDNNVVR